MAPIIYTDDLRATKLLDSAGVKYTLSRQVSAAPVSITKSNDFWTIEGVSYHGKVIPVHLSRKLLPAMNLRQMISHAKRVMTKDEPYSADAQLVYAIAKRAMEQDNREVQNFMRRAIFSNFPNTLSVVRYTPKGKLGKLDEIVHNPGLPGEYSAKVDFVAPGEWVRGSKRRNDYKALLGTDNPDEVDDVFGWVTGESAYLVRLNAKPTIVDERVVGLGANSGRFVLGCVRVPHNAEASFGVSSSQKILEHKS